MALRNVSVTHTGFLQVRPLQIYQNWLTTLTSVICFGTGIKLWVLEGSSVDNICYINVTSINKLGNRWLLAETSFTIWILGYVTCQIFVCLLFESTLGVQVYVYDFWYILFL